MTELIPMGPGTRRGPKMNNRTDYSRRNNNPIKTACPILREFFRISEEKRYDHYEIAAALDVHRVTVSLWRNGKMTPSMWTYLEFAKFLGVELRVIGARR